MRNFFLLKKYLNIIYLIELLYSAKTQHPFFNFTHIKDIKRDIKVNKYIVWLTIAYYDRVLKIFQIWCWIVTLETGFGPFGISVEFLITKVDILRDNKIHYYRSRYMFYWVYYLFTYWPAGRDVQMSIYQLSSYWTSENCETRCQIC